MRAILLAAALAVLAAPAMAPSAAACHPALVVEQDLGPGSGARVSLDMGCDHLPPYEACAAAWTVFAGLRALC